MGHGEYIASYYRPIPILLIVALFRSAAASYLLDYLVVLLPFLCLHSQGERDGIIPVDIATLGFHFRLFRDREKAAITLGLLKLLPLFVRLGLCLADNKLEWKSNPNSFKEIFSL